MEYTENPIATPNYSVKISENALKNIDEITGYIAFINYQPLNAIRIGDGLFELFDRIQVHPFLYPECKEIPTKKHIYRKAIFKSWYVIYKIKYAKIIILGIIHTSRHPSKIKALRKINE